MKTDVLGRVQTTPEQRVACLDAFEQCGMSGAAFARFHGIKYQTFSPTGGSTVEGTKCSGRNGRSVL